MEESEDTDTKIELLLQQLRLDIGKDSPLDVRTLSIENTRCPDSEAPAKDIDAQISDLEDLIKKLQEELAAISKCDQKMDDSEGILTKNEAGTDKIETEDIEPKTSCVVIQDGVMLEDAQEKFAGEVTKLITYQGSSEIIPESFSNIRTNFSALWTDMDPKNDHLDELITDLKAEICEKLETVKDIDLGPTSNNSQEHLQ